MRCCAIWGCSGREPLGTGQEHALAGETGSARLSVLMIHVWRTLPLATIILLAGLASIPEDIKDAADVDGASYLRQLFLIRFPLLLPIMAVAVLYGVVFTFTDMTVVYILTRGGPPIHAGAGELGVLQRRAGNRSGAGRGDRALPLPGAGGGRDRDAAVGAADGDGLMTTVTHPAESWSPSGDPSAGVWIPDNDPHAGAKKVARRGLLYSIATFFSVFAALPFAWMVFTIFKTNQDLYNGQNNPFLYNDPPTLDNVRLLFDQTNYATFVLNTVFVAIGVTIITVLIAVPAAYSLTRLVGGWGEGLGIAIFLVYLIPPTLLFIPMTRVVAELGLKNSRWSMVVIYPTFTIPFCVWLMMGFFKSIPGISKSRRWWMAIAGWGRSGGR